MSALIIKNLFNISKEQDHLDWQSFSDDQRTGVERVLLYNARDQNNKGPAAALLKYKAGAQVKRHVHLGYELIFVLHGTLHNDTGAHGPGTLEICPPGSTHKLWTDEGCIFLVVWEQPVKTENLDKWINELSKEGESYDKIHHQC